jgi:hypothetical protein
MRSSVVLNKLTRVFAVMMATIAINRGTGAGLPDSANACQNCETPIKCQGGLPTGFTNCKVENYPDGSDKCVPYGTTCGAGGGGGGGS